jgi:hypothetical protein
MKSLLTISLFLSISVLSGFSQSVGITGPPTACQGDKVTFQAVVVNDTVLSYQWRKNGVDIPSATDSVYVINSVMPSDEGLYTVRILGHPSNLTSPPHAFTVDLPPTIVLSGGKQDQAICPGDAIQTTSYSFGGGATGATASSLPMGLTSHVSGNTIEINGTPSVAGSYTITTTGGSCPATSISGSIEFLSSPHLELISGEQNQQVCSGDSIQTTVYGYGMGNAVAAVIINNLPPGLTSYIDTVQKTLKISGFPLQSGAYTISTISTCSNISITGTVGILSPPALSQIHGSISVCSNQKGLVYSVDSVPTAISYSWNVTGGTISAGDGTRKISVDWGLVSMSGSVRVTVSDTGICPSSQNLTVSVSQAAAIVPNDIVARMNAGGYPFMLLYPNPSGELFYQWYSNNEMIQGANEQFYYPPLVAAGTIVQPNTDYTVYVAPAAYRDCGNFSKTYRFENYKTSGFMVFPNPNHGNFDVSFGTETGETSGSVVEILSLEGKILAKINIGNEKERRIESGLQKGFYMIWLTTGKGEKYVRNLVVD